MSASSIALAEKGSSRSARLTVGLATIESYISAVTDLYKEQVARGVNSNPHPRNATITALLNSLRREKHEKSKADYVDRGVGTMLDGYSSVSELQQICDFYLESSSGDDLRNRMCHLLCHSCLLRGESARSLELPDLFSVELENEGFSQCRALVLLMKQGKTNQFNRREFGSCLRHKNVRICAVGAVAMYLFWRFDVENEPIPDFSDPPQWYDIKLLKGGKDQTSPISYKAHYDATMKAFKALGMQSKAKTHAARGSATRMAELAGASESQIRRLGRWNASAMEGCYLSALPREAMRTLAGFPPDQRVFYLNRAAVAPDSAIQAKGFPFLDGQWE